MTAALIKAAQTLLVVVLSAVFFCGEEASQCMTVERAASVALVLMGLVWYGWR